MEGDGLAATLTRYGSGEGNTVQHYYAGAKGGKPMKKKCKKGGGKGGK